MRILRWHTATLTFDDEMRTWSLEVKHVVRSSKSMIGNHILEVVVILEWSAASYS